MQCQASYHFAAALFFTSDNVFLSLRPQTDCCNACYLLQVLRLKQEVNRIKPCSVAVKEQAIEKAMHERFDAQKEDVQQCFNAAKEKGP